MKIQSLRMVQIIKVINVDGRLCHIGDRITINSDRAKRMITLGYAVKVDPEAPYTFPVKDEKHGFHPVNFDEPKKKAKEGVPTFKELGISSFAIGELRKEKIWVLGDLKGIKKIDLMSIPKITPKTADKLLEAYKLYIEGVKPEDKLDIEEKEE